ncbi:M1 family metallopeptidase [Xanthomonas campestris pv. asclepiadis]|uniref:M1 family metallopeptidase n=1 Tax=Xanthomonas campestris TaxID=339 RepID=UPI001E4EF4E0|nr:M1 family metallopeptidase [Xanthomonas campestris]MCC4617225.1 M1 family metallopeptidase [Xanthomonas campestris pv. asclepiadis]
MRQIFKLPLALALMTTVAQPAMPAPSTASARTVTSQLPRTVRPTHYTLDIVPHAEKLSFDGKAAINIVVLQPTDSITLNSAELSFKRSTLLRTENSKLLRATVSTDAAAQTATFAFAESLQPGNYLLSIDYSGVINTRSNGLFSADFTTRQGQRRALLTQFEVASARSFIPSWDEPNYKATFDLAVTVPATQMAVSNMPVAATTQSAGGLKRVLFERSPKMSTYLLFLGVGDFERTTIKANDGTQIGVVAQKGKHGQTGFALDSSRAILQEYNDYFGIPYPLPKLDNIAAPARFTVAMENWGAILSAERYLLLDPATADIKDKQLIFSIAAHEIAHQWFGNLVTMAWWDDLWLNEGFANWLGARTTMKLHPEWDADNTFAAERSRRAMQLDALVTTHPIVQHVATVQQADEAFDQITYDKGEAVIAMLEDYIGADHWRDGVRRYIAQHRYGNTATNELWQQLDAEAPDRQLMQVANDFTLQPGVPLIKVSSRCVADHTAVTLEQGEYTIDRPDKSPLRWRVPVALRSHRGSLTRTLVDGRAQVQLPRCDSPVLINAGQSGYYRTLYAPALFKELSTGFSALPVVDQMGVLMDASALVAAGLQPEADLLDLIDGVHVNASPDLWGEIAQTLVEIDALFDGDSKGQIAWRNHAVAVLTPVFSKLGWDPRPGETSQTRQARGQLLTTLGVLGDPAVIAEARRRFIAFQLAPDALSTDMRKPVLQIVAQHADAATWDALHAMAKGEASASLREQYYSLLGSVQNAALAQRALELALSDEPTGNIGVRVLVAVSRQHPDLAFEFSVAHLQQVNALIAASQSNFYPRLANGSANLQTAEKVREYAEKNLDPTSRGDAEATIAAIQTRAKLRERRVPQIQAWLEARKASQPLRVDR